MSRPSQERLSKETKQAIEAYKKLDNTYMPNLAYCASEQIGAVLKPWQVDFLNSADFDLAKIVSELDDTDETELKRVFMLALVFRVKNGKFDSRVAGPLRVVGNSRTLELCDYLKMGLAAHLERSLPQYLLAKHDTFKYDYCVEIFSMDVLARDMCRWMLMKHATRHTPEMSVHTVRNVVRLLEHERCKCQRSTKRAPTT